MAVGFHISSQRFLLVECEAGRRNVDHDHRGVGFQLRLARQLIRIAYVEAQSRIPDRRLHRQALVLSLFDDQHTRGWLHHDESLRNVRVGLDGGRAAHSRADAMEAFGRKRLRDRDPVAAWR